LTNRKAVVIVALLIALSGSIIAYTAASSSLSLGINPGGSDGSGRLVTSLTSIAEIFSVIRGEAETINGVELYKIELDNNIAQFSNLVRINVALLNPQDMGKVFNNPRTFIDVGIWYPDVSGTQTLSDNTRVARDNDPRASAVMSSAAGDILLYPSVAGQDTLYVLASITVPGGIPPGQQEQLTSLKFYCDVRINGGIPES